MVNLLMMTGQEAQKSSREGKRGGIKETTETGSTMQEFEPVAPLCLPGLYKSKPHGPAVNMQRQAKSQGKHSLPGRLRKKLAKEQGRGGRALCKRGKGNP